MTSFTKERKVCIPFESKLKQSCPNCNKVGFMLEGRLISMADFVGCSNFAHLENTWRDYATVSGWLFNYNPLFITSRTSFTYLVLKFILMRLEAATSWSKRVEWKEFVCSVESLTKCSSWCDASFCSKPCSCVLAVGKTQHGVTLRPLS